MRTGLRMILQLEQDMEVWRRKKRGERSSLQWLRPAIVLADISMPPPNGIELTRLLTRDAPDLKTIIVTMHEEATLVRSALAAGAAVT